MEITGSTASEIADSLRAMIERGMLRPGDPLPRVRSLAESLGVNRNTVVAAYGQLSQAGIIVTRGRGGTHVADRSTLALDGFTADTVLRDVGTGNPDPELIPDLSHALERATGRPVLYGEPVIDQGLERWALEWMGEAIAQPDSLSLTVTSGAADAVERLLAQTLTRDDAVALEDPCFLASIRTVRLGGYRPIPVPVDDEGMTVHGLRSALADGVRAVICTPRAQNPTGASLSARRAEALREVLRRHPYVLVIEDDHFSMLSRRPYNSLIGPDHRRWAVIRSVSKFLGPDMCLAVTASDPETAERLATRLTPGTTWVSHLLQRLTHALVTDPDVTEAIARAGAHYAARNDEFARRLTERGLPAAAGDGLNLWVALGVPAAGVAERLRRRGWLVRSGEDFLLAGEDSAERIRLTVHDLDDTEADQLAADIVEAVDAATADAASARAGVGEVG